MSQESAGMWYGFLSMVSGIFGVMLVVQGAMAEPRSGLSFSLGLFTFGASFLLKLLHLIYR